MFSRSTAAALSSLTHPSVLVIGATGLTGAETIRQLSQSPTKPLIHAFCRAPSKLHGRGLEKLLESVQKGNVRNAGDLDLALESTQADIVIVAVGNGESVKKNDIRQANAQALARVLPKYRDVKVIVVSSTGASSSDIVVGFGIGKLISYHLLHVLKDHTGQEKALKPFAARTAIVRATALTDGAATGRLVEFGDKVQGPSIKTDRHDLAAWIVDQVETNVPKAGTAVNVTSVPKQ